MSAGRFRARVNNPIKRYRIINERPRVNGLETRSKSVTRDKKFNWSGLNCILYESDADDVCDLHNRLGRVGTSFHLLPHVSHRAPLELVSKRCTGCTETVNAAEAHDSYTRVLIRRGKKTLRHRRRSFDTVNATARRYCSIRRNLQVAPTVGLPRRRKLS